MLPSLAALTPDPPRPPNPRPPREASICNMQLQTRFNIPTALCSDTTHVVCPSHLLDLGPASHRLPSPSPLTLGSSGCDPLQTAQTPASRLCPSHPICPSSALQCQCQGTQQRQTCKGRCGDHTRGRTSHTIMRLQLAQNSNITPSHYNTHHMLQCTPHSPA